MKLERIANKTRKGNVLHSFAISLLLLATLGCRSDPLEDHAYIESLEVEGGYVTRIVIQNDNGDLQAYSVDDPPALQVSTDHLRLHQSQRMPVRLILQARGNELLVMSIDDYVQLE